MAGLSKARTRLAGRLHRRRAREREGRVLVEGPRAVREVRRALATGAPWLDGVVDGAGGAPWYVASPRLDELDPELAAELADADTARVDDAELARLADTEAPQGVLMVLSEPRPTLESVARPGARLLVLDGIQDPGNLGTLVRCAAAFALDGVVTLDGTVDPWNPKAVRAAAGTSFRLPVLRAPWHRLDAAIVEAGLTLFVADAGGTDAAVVTPSRGWALVVGSEAHGARPEVRRVADTTLAIPMPGGTESLNAGVAGALLLYALTGDGSARNGPGGDRA